MKVKIKKFADTNPRIYFCTPGNQSELKDQYWKTLPIYLKAIHTKQSSDIIAPKSSLIGICFFPYALQDIFDISPKELIDLQINIDDVKGQELTDALLFC